MINRLVVKNLIPESVLEVSLKNLLKRIYINTCFIEPVNKLIAKFTYIDKNKTLPAQK